MALFGHKDAGELGRLDAACHKLESAGKRRDMQAFAAADIEFHRTLWELSGNAVIEEVLAGISARFFGYGLIRDLRQARLYEFDRVVAGHRRMVDLVTNGPARRIGEGFSEIYAQFLAYSLQRFAAHSSASVEPAETS